MSTPTNATYLGGEPGHPFTLPVRGRRRRDRHLRQRVRSCGVGRRPRRSPRAARTVSCTGLPGRFSWPNIVLKRGLTQADALFDWMQKTSGDGFAANNNAVTRTTGAITAIASNGDPDPLLEPGRGAAGSLERSGLRRRHQCGAVRGTRDLSPRIPKYDPVVSERRTRPTSACERHSVGRRPVAGRSGGRGAGSAAAGSVGLGRHRCAAVRPVVGHPPEVRRQFAGPSEIRVARIDRQVRPPRWWMPGDGAAGASRSLPRWGSAATVGRPARAAGLRRTVARDAERADLRARPDAGDDDGNAGQGAAPRRGRPRSARCRRANCCRRRRPVGSGRRSEAARARRGCRRGTARPSGPPRPVPPPDRCRPPIPVARHR